ncbi:single-stranded DNA-binding protein [Granulicatella sp. zg-84]|nr:single-stranded DNA-binding protein [Granulicatella sp. zg-84]
MCQMIELFYVESKIIKEYIKRMRFDKRISFFLHILKIGGDKMNDVSVIGRIVKPIHVKEIGTDKYVINNILAISKKKKEGSEQTADFIPIVVWGKPAQIIEQYCEKGNLIGVTGRLSSRQYMAQGGKYHFIVEIIVSKIHLIEGKRYVNER